MSLAVVPEERKPKLQFFPLLQGKATFVKICSTPNNGNGSIVWKKKKKEKYCREAKHQIIKLTRSFPGQDGQQL